MYLGSEDDSDDISYVPDTPMHRYRATLSYVLINQFTESVNAIRVRSGCFQVLVILFKTSAHRLRNSTHTLFKTKQLEKIR